MSDPGRPAIGRRATQVIEWLEQLRVNALSVSVEHPNVELAGKCLQAQEVVRDLLSELLPLPPGPETTT